MSALYVTEFGCVISFSENYVKVSLKDEVCTMIPVETLESISIFSKNQMTTQCVEECLKRGIPVSYFSKGGQYFGQLISTGHVNTERQRKQAALYNSDFSIILAKKIIKAKIKNQEVVLKRYQRTTGKNVEDICRKMLYYQRKIDYCKTIEELMGYEGLSARLYFEGLNTLVDEKFSFNGRSKRPPKDEFNSMLSLGYSIVINELYGKIQNRGLNPYFGFIHRDQEKHPSLASDLIEEWRAVLVDSLVMSLINGHEIDKEHFETADGVFGIYLTKEGMKIFINKMDAKLRTEVGYLDYTDQKSSYRRAMDLQIRQLIKAIENEDADMYHPIIVR